MADLIIQGTEEGLKMRFPILLCVALCAVLSAATGAGQTRGGPVVLEQIKQTIAKVQSGKTVDARTKAAEHLADLTQKISNKNKEVTDALVTDLTSLLDSPDDSARFWVATAIGNLGPVAKSAVPKLEKLLPQADCLDGTITSASAIRHSLIKMGIKPPPPPKCERERIAG